VEISKINVTPTFLSRANANGAGSHLDIRLFPAARSHTEVIGTYDRFGVEGQRWEIVSENGQVSTRPWVPEPEQKTVSRFGFADNDGALAKAA
jgi:hypothetical protein